MLISGHPYQGTRQICVIFAQKTFPVHTDKTLCSAGDNSIILANFMIDVSVQNLKVFTGQGIVFRLPTRP